MGLHEIPQIITSVLLISKDPNIPPSIMIMCPKFAATFQATRHFQQVSTVKFHKAPLTALVLESL